MAYNPSVYNQWQQWQTQPVNGLVSVSGEQGAQMYPLPPNSVSPPLFLQEENAFFVKRTDGGGAATLKKYTFQEAPAAAAPQAPEFVTKEYFDQQMQTIMEAINGKHPVPEQQPTGQHIARND